IVFVLLLFKLLTLQSPGEITNRVINYYQDQLHNAVADAEKAAEQFPALQRQYLARWWLKPPDKLPESAQTPALKAIFGEIEDLGFGEDLAQLVLHTQN